MGTKPRDTPARLPFKLKTVRQRLDASQSQMASLLEFKDRSPARISEWESGQREPSLIILLRYAKLGQICVDQLIDDAVDLTFPKTRIRCRGR